MPLRSFIHYTPDCDFPIENLPYGVFSTNNDETPRIGVAIGCLILDLKKTDNVFLGPLLKEKQNVFKKTTLNDFMALGKPYWKEARESLQSYLSIDNHKNKDRSTFVKQCDASMHLPATIGDYTDFFSSYYHAYNCIVLMSNKTALNPNWRWVPIGYHGRSSSICVSGTPVKRPIGQFIENPSDSPIFGECKRLDFELEVGVFVGGPLNKVGETFDIASIDDNIFGMVLLNDWSARDIQGWEMVPLGPFLSKNFTTSISPWIVTMEALEPFKTENTKQDPTPLPYLRHSDAYNFDITLEAHLKTKNSTNKKLCESNFKYLYWTAKQMLCHHMITGCNMRPGDLMGSGTISGPTDDSRGCLTELTFNKKKPIILDDGQTRTFLEDGDEVTFIGHCNGNGYRLGFGTCTGKILPSR